VSPHRLTGHPRVQPLSLHHPFIPCGFDHLGGAARLFDPDPLRVDWTPASAQTKNVDPYRVGLVFCPWPEPEDNRTTPTS
jgi:hypothetical protein